MNRDEKPEAQPLQAPEAWKVVLRALEEPAEPKPAPVLPPLTEEQRRLLFENTTTLILQLSRFLDALLPPEAEAGGESAG